MVLRDRDVSTHRQKGRGVGLAVSMEDRSPKLARQLLVIKINTVAVRPGAPLSMVFTVGVGVGCR